MWLLRLINNLAWPSCERHTAVNDLTVGLDALRRQAKLEETGLLSGAVSVPGLS